MEKKTAFTLIELLVVIAIISLLVSILLPSLTKAREIARAVACKSLLRNMSMATVFFGEDNEGYFPYCPEQQVSFHWKNAMAPYLDIPMKSNGYLDARDGKVPAFECPSSIQADDCWVTDYRVANGRFADPTSNFYYYGIVGLTSSRKAISRKFDDFRKSPAEVVWITEGVTPGSDSLLWYSGNIASLMIHISLRHEERVNLLMADGSVQDIWYDEFEPKRQILYR